MLLLLRKEIEGDQEGGSRSPSCVCRWVERPIGGERLFVGEEIRKERTGAKKKVTVVKDGKVRGLLFGPVRIVITKKRNEKNKKYNLVC